MILAQSEIITLGSNPKTWLVVIGGMLVSMIVGRFAQSWRNGAGIKGAIMAIWFGTNTPKGMPAQVQANTDNSNTNSAAIKAQELRG